MILNNPTSALNQDIVNTITRRLLAEESHYELPSSLQVWETQEQCQNLLIHLASTFTKHLNQLVEVTPNVIDEMNIPIEMQPCYHALHFEYLSGKMINHKLCFPQESVHYLIDRVGTINDHNMYLLYNWELLNRFLDPLPLGAIAAKSVIEIKMATPKRIKQLIKWHQNINDRLTRYQLTDSQGYKIKPCDNVMPHLDGMSKIIIYSEFKTFVNHWWHAIDHVESNTSTKIKLLLLHFDEVSEEKCFRQLYFEEQIQLGKFIKLLPNCVEEEAKYIEL